MAASWLGNLSSDPGYQASVAATSQLDMVYNWATCARLADPPLAGACRDAALKGRRTTTARRHGGRDPRGAGHRFLNDRRGALDKVLGGPA